MPRSRSCTETAIVLRARKIMQAERHHKLAVSLQLNAESKRRGAPSRQNRPIELSHQSSLPSSRVRAASATPTGSRSAQAGVAAQAAHGVDAAEGGAAEKVEIRRNVEFFHRKMVRREVWLQKFAVLDRKAQADVFESAGFFSHASGPAANNCAASSCSSGPKSGAGDASERPRAESEAARHAQCADDPGTEPSTCRGSVCTLVPEAEVQDGRPTDAGTQQRAISKEFSSVAKVLPLRKGYKNMPDFSDELCKARDGFYGGDEIFMLEDMLHISNPRLFPLRKVKT